MYYEIGEIIRKNIHVNGFDFKLFILKGHMGISIQVKDMRTTYQLNMLMS
ncbi:phage protein [Staphylococcus aureus]|nr:phage protein [Staphylococcus aureus]